MLAAQLTTARHTLYYAADRIIVGLTPAARAMHTAETFRQLGDSAAGDLPLTPADLVAGLELVAQPLATDEPAPVAARRKTCAEIVELLRPVSAGDARRLAVVLRAVESHFGKSTDPRQTAIGATAGREASEIDAATTDSNAAIRALHDLAWEHKEIPFAHMCSAALNGEAWAVERITAVLVYREYIARNYPSRINEHLLIEIRAANTTPPGGGALRSL